MTAVVGLDLSLTATGIATPYGVQTVGSRGKASDGLAERRHRLKELSTRIIRAITDGTPPNEPWLVVVEAPAFDSRTGHQHDRSGLWWLVVDDLAAWGSTVVEVTTGGVKKYATGKGNAPKDSVLLAVARRFPDHEVTDNNQADALVLRAMGCDHLGQPIATMPQTHRSALEAIRWPPAAVPA